MPEEDASFSAEGGCACGAVRYRMNDRPLFVHCCHCTWCQRETGSAFAVNAMIETALVDILKGDPVKVPIPSESGGGQRIVRCPECQVALWSYYSGIGEKVSFVRAGTLDTPDLVQPDIHIFTASKQPWIALPPDKPAYKGYYNWKKEWPAEAQARRAVMRAKRET